MNREYRRIVSGLRGLVQSRDSDFFKPGHEKSDMDIQTQVNYVQATSSYYEHRRICKVTERIVILTLIMISGCA